jgi:nucleotide-binding universal stress UspA family protein
MVLAVDGRATSDNPTRWAAERLRRSDATLHIVSVATDDSFLHDIAELAVERALRIVEETVPHARATTEVLNANVFDALRLASEDADLLVVGNDREDSLATALLGSLPMHLSDRVDCDLAVVPEGWNASQRSGVVAVGWEDDHVGFEAIEFAAREAESSESSLRIIHVWEPFWVSPYDADGAEFAGHLERTAEAAVLEAADLARRRHPGLSITAELHRGSVVHGLMSQVGDVDVMVVGSHRRNVVGRALVGSTGDALIRASDSVPILIAGASDRLIDQLPRRRRQP